MLRTSLNKNPSGLRFVHDLIPLSLLSPGQCARVDRITGRPDEVHRLEELGLRGGAAIEMLQSGSPCIIRLAGQKLCLRADELLSVLVRCGAAS
jgi:Fe2+ transport system protein FeoA